MMRVSKSLITFLSACAVVLVFSACGGSKSASSQNAQENCVAPVADAGVVSVGIEKGPVIKKSDELAGGKYRTVQIGGRLWMAENLNEPAAESYCYQEDPEKCKGYGRLYTLDAASKACPAGWKLPSMNEWKSMVESAGEDTVAQKEIDALFSNPLAGFGTQFLAAGKFHYGGEGDFVQYWTSSLVSEDSTEAYLYGIQNVYERLTLRRMTSPINGYKYNKRFFYYVRCIKEIKYCE